MMEFKTNKILTKESKEKKSEIKKIKIELEKNNI